MFLSDSLDAYTESMFNIQTFNYIWIPTTMHGEKCAMFTFIFIFTFVDYRIDEIYRKIIFQITRSRLQNRRQHKQNL